MNFHYYCVRWDGMLNWSGHRQMYIVHSYEHTGADVEQHFMGYFFEFEMEVVLHVKLITYFCYGNHIYLRVM